MIILHFTLDLYLAAVLGVAGLTKVKEPAAFALALRRQRILPLWSIPYVSRLLPRAEVVLASILVIGVADVMVAILVLTLFTIFLIVEATLLMTGRATGCGCYGARAQKVTGASVTTSICLLCLAAVHMWAAIDGALVPWPWRLTAVLLLWGAGGWLLWRVMCLRRWRASRSPASSPPSRVEYHEEGITSTLDYGELGPFLPPLGGA